MECRVAEVSPLSIIQPVQRFLVGLGASVAGISALFYGSGYLVTRGHLNALGLYGIVEESNDSLLQEGGKFFFATGFLILRTALAFTPIVVIVAILVLVLVWIAKLPWVGRAAAPAIRYTQRFVSPRLFRRACYVLAFALLIWLIDRFLDDAQAPASVSNLLFADGTPQGTGTPPSGDIAALSASIKSALLRGDGSHVSYVYGMALCGAVLTVAIASATWWLTSMWRFRLLACAPFIFGSSVFVLLLPFDYGVLQRDIEFPRIVAHVAPDKSTNGDMTGYLVQKSASSLLIWNAELHRLNEIQLAQVLGLEILGNERPFHPPMAAPRTGSQ